MSLRTSQRFQRRVGEAIFRLGIRTFGRFMWARERGPFPVLYRHLAAKLARPNAVVEVRGFKIHLDPLDSLQLGARGQHDPLESKIYEEYVRPGFVVADVGANIGYFTLQFSRLVGTAGSVYAFEPFPPNLKLLAENLRINGCQNVVVVDAAVADHAGTAALYVSGQSAGDHRLARAEEHRETILVRSVGLAKYFGELGVFPDFLKLDIQGSEGRALHGLADLIANTDKIALLIEFCPALLRRAGDNPGEVYGRLNGLGLTISHVDARKRSVYPANLDELLERFDRGTEYSTNLLCTKGYGPTGGCKWASGSPRKWDARTPHSSRPLGREGSGEEPRASTGTAGGNPPDGGREDVPQRHRARAGDRSEDGARPLALGPSGSARPPCLAPGPAGPVQTVPTGSTGPVPSLLDSALRGDPGSGIHR